jgi:hypothetical protein
MAGGRRRIRGDRAFRKLMRRMPEAIRQEIIALLDEGGREILAMQQADATVSQRTRAALSMRVLRGSLRLRVGIVGRPANRRLWWARVIEKGRKPSVENAVRRSQSGKLSRYQIRVPAMAARPFIYSPRVEEKRRTMGGRTTLFWERTLRRASQGATDA